MCLSVMCVCVSCVIYLKIVYFFGAILVSRKSPRNTELKKPAKKVTNTHTHVSAAHHQTLTKVLLLTTATKIVPISLQKKIFNH